MYDRHTIRLRGYEYSAPGLYYVTVCEKSGKCLFGEVVDCEVKLSALGEIVRDCWEGIPKHFENADVDRYIIMPNHVHGIVILNESLVGTRHADGKNKISGRGFIHETLSSKGLINQTPTNTNSLALPLMKDSRITLGKIVRAYKAQCSKLIHDAGHPEFHWQRNYYEHIVRDGNDLDRIREYILENPMNWEHDEYFPGNIRMSRLHSGERDFSSLD